MLVFARAKQVMSNRRNVTALCFVAATLSWPAVTSVTVADAAVTVAPVVEQRVALGREGQARLPAVVRATAGSEPDTEAMMALTPAVEPRFSVVLHQPLLGSVPAAPS